MLLWEGPPQFLVWFPVRPQTVLHCPLTSSTSYSNRMESGEAVAAEVSRSRSTTIEISNMTDNYCLISPRYVPALWDGLEAALMISHMYSGAAQGVSRKWGNVQPTSAHGAPHDVRGLRLLQVQRRSDRQHWCADIRSLGEVSEWFCGDAGHHVLCPLGLQHLQQLVCSGHL